MKNYRPLLLQDLQLRLPNVEVMRLRLNQHMPEARWNPHQHEHDQILIYLMGRGVQWVDGKTYQAQAGTVIHVAKHTTHAFEQTLVQHPLCLVLDVNLGSNRGTSHVCDQLNASQLNFTRGRISELFQHQQIEARDMSLKVGAVVLDVLDLALKSIGWLNPVNRFSSSRQFTLERRAERLLTAEEHVETELAVLAEKLGYQQDHLNRLLRAECGLTLGQLRSRVRLKRAVDLIQKRVPIHEVGARIGILDANYFSRWFKQQTGVTPSQWARQQKELKS